MYFCAVLHALKTVAWWGGIGLARHGKHPNTVFVLGGGAGPDARRCWRATVWSAA